MNMPNYQAGIRQLAELVLVLKTAKAARVESEHIDLDPVPVASGSLQPIMADKPTLVEISR